MRSLISEQLETIIFIVPSIGKLTGKLNKLLSNNHLETNFHNLFYVKAALLSKSPATLTGIIVAGMDTSFAYQVVKVGNINTFCKFK